VGFSREGSLVSIEIEKFKLRETGIDSLKKVGSKKIARRE
jgi:hypothetical protein